MGMFNLSFDGGHPQSSRKTERRELLLPNTLPFSHRQNNENGTNTGAATLMASSPLPSCHLVAEHWWWSVLGLANSHSAAASSGTMKGSDATGCCHCCGERMQLEVVIGRSKGVYLMPLLLVSYPQPPMLASIGIAILSSSFAEESMPQGSRVETINDAATLLVHHHYHVGGGALWNVSGGTRVGYTMKMSSSLSLWQTLRWRGGGCYGCRWVAKGGMNVVLPLTG